MKIDRKQLISAIIALCVLIGCVVLLITKGFVIRFAVSAALALAWMCITAGPLFTAASFSHIRKKEVYIISKILCLAY